MRHGCRCNGDRANRAACRLPDSWLAVLKADNRAIVQAASQASKAADFILAFEDGCHAETVVEMDEAA